MSDQPLTTADLDAIAARCEAATAGEWGASGDMVSNMTSKESMRRIRDGEFPFTRIRVCSTKNETYLTDEQCEANAAFIAACRTDVPALLAEVRRLRSDLEACLAIEPTITYEQAKRIVEALGGTVYHPDDVGDYS